mmetsp:Transcript_68618/g.182301  ORF Transcript_68618/g.182301 Transcript_68618/m.182301 type:complete len:313 (-) Transcript_68618:2367-3305(-)
MGARVESAKLLDSGVPCQRSRDGCCHIAQLRIGVHERLIGLLVDHQGIDFVQDEHAIFVFVEVRVNAPRDAGIERLHVLRLAVADICLRVHAQDEALVGAVGRHLVRGCAQNGIQRPLRSPRSGGHLEIVKQPLEIREVALEQGLIVDHDVRFLAEHHGDVDGQGGHDHGLALAGAHLGDQRVRGVLGLLGLQEALEREEGDHLRVVRQDQEVELGVHGLGPLVEDLPERPEALGPEHARRRPPQLLQDGLHVFRLHEAAPRRQAHQLLPRRVLALGPGEVAGDGGLQLLGLLPELQVRQSQVFAGGILQEK